MTPTSSSSASTRHAASTSSPRTSWRIDHERCRAFADALRNERSAPPLLRVPSAALPGTENLVIFGPRVAIPWNVEPIDESELSVSVAAEQARPPDALLDLVRFRGEAHAGLDAWRSP